MRILIAACLVAALSACSLTAPRDVGNANRFTLDAPEDITADQHKEGMLRVNYPTVPSELDTYRIAVTKADGGEDYFAGARWNSFLPSVLQSALRETISKSQLFSYVETDEVNASGKYILNVDVSDCRAVYETPQLPPSIVMSMDFRIVSTSSGKMVSHFSVSKKMAAESNSLAAIAKAFNATFAELAREAVDKLETVK